MESITALEEALTQSKRSILLATARQALVNHTIGKSSDAASGSDSCSATGGLSISNGCFVTLRIGKALRGCIGSLGGKTSLCERVLESAINAGTHDPRFHPIKADEVDKIRINISVLTEPEELSFKNPDDLLSQLMPGRHGVVFRKGNSSATYLPQVWKMVPDKETFLAELCRKAGLNNNAWRDSDAVVSTFEAVSFSEEGYGEES